MTSFLRLNKRRPKLRCTHMGGTVEPSWRWVRDWMGDPQVPHGTLDCSHYECIYCGEEHDPDQDEPIDEEI